MKILGIIPARGGSKGIPKKNIKRLHGEPLISYSIKTALASKLDRVIVSTDCKEIATISRDYGSEVIMRPPSLSADKTSTLPVIQDVVAKLDEKFDAVMTLQPTSPFRSINDINKCIEIFCSDKEADSLVSIVEVPHNFMPEKLMTLNGKYLTGNNQILQRQDISTKYARNGSAIIITKTEKLSEFIFGGNTLPYVMSKLTSIDIDDMDDWEMAEKLF